MMSSARACAACCSATGASVWSRIPDSQPAALARKIRADLIITDPAQVGRFDLALIDEVREAAPCSAIAVLSSQFDLTSFTAAVHKGVLGYFLPAFAAHGEALLYTLVPIARWHVGCTDPAISASFQSSCGTELQVHEPLEPGRQLTDRERQILACLVRGLNHSEVAAALRIAHGTVDAHVANIGRKLGASSPVQLGAIARDQRFLYRLAGIS